MLALGIDLGGTHIKIALVNQQGKLVREMQLETQVKLGPVRIISEIKKAGRALMENAHTKKIKGIGVGVAGDVDQKRGKVRFSPNLGWRNVPLGTALKRSFNMPVVVDNDANVAAWGAYILEAKKKVKNLIAVTLGTGVGGGIIIDGKLFHGASGTAGEIGHVPIYPNGLKCSCGSRGCLECYVGAPHLVRQAKDAIRAGQETALVQMVHGYMNALTPIIIELAAKKGDRLSVKIWEDAGRNLGIALSGLINLFNPEMIVLAGGTSRAGKLITGPMWKAVKQYSFKSPRRTVSIVLSQRDKDLGVAGAGLLLWQKINPST